MCIKHKLLVVLLYLQSSAEGAHRSIGPSAPIMVLCARSSSPIMVLCARPSAPIMVLCARPSAPIMVLCAGPIAPIIVLCARSSAPILVLCAQVPLVVGSLTVHNFVFIYSENKNNRNPKKYYLEKFKRRTLFLEIIFSHTKFQRTNKIFNKTCSCHLYVNYTTYFF